MLTEESLGSDVLLIQNVHQRDCVLGKGSCENDNFEVLADLIDELTAVGSHLHIDVVHATLNVYWKNNICLVGLVER